VQKHQKSAPTHDKLWAVKQLQFYVISLKTQLAAQYPSMSVLDAFAVLFSPRAYPAMTDVDRLKAYGTDELKTVKNFCGSAGLTNPLFAVSEASIEGQLTLEQEFVAFRSAMARAHDTYTANPATAAPFNRLKDVAILFIQNPAATESNWSRMYVLYCYVATMIIAAVENERLFSLLKLIETDRRNNLSIDAINNLMRIANYGPTPIEFFRGFEIPGSPSNRILDLWFNAGSRYVSMGATSSSSKATKGVTEQELDQIHSGKYNERTPEEKLAAKRTQQTEREEGRAWSFGGGRFTKASPEPVAKKVRRKLATASTSHQTHGNSMFNPPTALLESAAAATKIAATAAAAASSTTTTTEKEPHKQPVPTSHAATVTNETSAAAHDDATPELSSALSLEQARLSTTLNPEITEIRSATGPFSFLADASRTGRARNPSHRVIEAAQWGT
jgi:hypothetical protein